MTRYLLHSFLKVLVFIFGLTEAAANAATIEEPVETSVRISSAQGEPYFGGQNISVTRLDADIECDADLSGAIVYVSSPTVNFGFRVSGHLTFPGVTQIGPKQPKSSLTINGDTSADKRPEGTLEILHWKFTGWILTELWMLLNVSTHQAENADAWNPPLLVEVRYNLPASIIGQRPPCVTAGVDQKIMQRQHARVAGAVIHDRAEPLSLSWSKVLGPGDVHFADPSAGVTDVTFSSPGTYALRLTADDGVNSESDDVAVEVSPLETSLTIRGLPLIAGAHPFVEFHTADSFWIRSQLGYGSTYNLLELRRGWSEFLNFRFSREFSSDVWEPRVFNSGPFNNTAPVIGVGPPNWDTSMQSRNFAIYEIATDESGKLTALHAELLGETRTHRLIVEIRFNANWLSSARQNGVPRVVTPGPHLQPKKSFSLDASITDDPLPLDKLHEVTWELIEGPSIAIFDDPHCLRPVVQVSEEGTYRFRVTVDDGEFSVSSESIVVVRRGRTRQYRGVVTMLGETVGRFTVSQKVNGSFTAHVTVGGTRFPMKGKFLHGNWAKIFDNVHGDQVGFHLSIDASGTEMLGLIAVGDRHYELFGNELLKPALATGDLQSERAGSYNNLLMPSGSIAPHAYGFARLTVSRLGDARGVARLPDGKAVSFGSTLTTANLLPFFGTMYGGRGSLGGEWRFDTTHPDAQLRMRASLLWIRPPRPGHGPFSEAFASRVEALGSPFTAPTAGSNLFTHQSGHWDGLFEAAIDGAGDLLSVPVRFNADGTVVPLVAAPGFGIKIRSKDGTFSGTFSDPRDGSRRIFHGMIIPKAVYAGGYFSTPEGAGRVRVTANSMIPGS